MNEVVRTMSWDPATGNLESLVTREWLVTNGLGGYASGTVAGVATRRYHGLLVAAMPAPLGRMMMLNHLSELVRLADGTLIRLSDEERQPQPVLYSAHCLQQFRIEMGLPVWQYRVGSCVVEKRVFMPHQQNTVYVNYRVVGGDETLRLKLLPSVHFRSHDAPVSSPIPDVFTLNNTDDQLELTAGDGLPTLRMTTYGHRQAFTIERRRLTERLYRIEEMRGYESVGDLWTPGYFRFDISATQSATVVASTEPWDRILEMSFENALEAALIRRRRLIATAPETVRTGPGAELVIAADQFLIRPMGRRQDLKFAQATGDEARTVIAGYHWFTDWGRDTMISLEGLTLTTGRHAEAGHILRTFAHHVRDGLIPNMFPEGEEQGLYHTADASLWFVHAVDRYVSVTEDRATFQQLLPVLREIIDRHIQGTRFHIGMDGQDALLHQGEVGYQLTWMDAKMGDWVVTPRRGKAVEINALWYNAMCLLAAWLRDSDAVAAEKYAVLAGRIQESFNRRFWNDQLGHLFDVVDSEGRDDPACRPNQIFAISLPHPVLHERHWCSVLETVERFLLTPVGLRSLSPQDKEYKATYHGDLRTRDAAYHQGTVWGWLIGPFMDAWRKVHPNADAAARQMLSGLIDHLGEACIGSISEVFDAESPYTPRGCCAQAWSVAELLRSLDRIEAGRAS
jgi:predicted glycogen debranching enzyme